MFVHIHVCVVRAVVTVVSIVVVVVDDMNIIIIALRTHTLADDSSARVDATTDTSHDLHAYCSRE